ncbi:MAG: hypothetical protein HW373_1685 [Deltaproteobacteria bacterium]|nr:hypothetical protein [Deltaproteobacteria bacterium]
MAELATPAPFKVAKINPQMVSRGKKGQSLFDGSGGDGGRRDQSARPCR